MPDTQLSTIEQLARCFSLVIREWLTSVELAEAIEKNASYDGKGCATGDYCDSNVAMDEAFFVIFGHGIDTVSQPSMDIANEAWDLAIANKFYITSNSGNN